MNDTEFYQYLENNKFEELEISRGQTTQTAQTTQTTQTGQISLRSRMARRRHLGLGQSLSGPFGEC